MSANEQFFEKLMKDVGSDQVQNLLSEFRNYMSKRALHQIKDFIDQFEADEPSDGLIANIIAAVINNMMDGFRKLWDEKGEGNLQPDDVANLTIHA